MDSHALVAGSIICDGQSISICGDVVSLADIDRVCVVGAGKAGAGMVAGLETVLEHHLKDRLFGVVNVPNHCVKTLKQIRLHGGRPESVNEPTEDGVAGSREILQLIQSLTERDLCIVLLSGGGSALLPAPVPEISLADKQAVTRMLMKSGATIGELNCVRKKLSTLKGGGLARECRAKRLVSLIISDVIDDPLDVIASGPTVPDSSSVADALAVLKKFDPQEQNTPDSVLIYLRDAESSPREQAFPERVSNHIIGNNAVCLQAAEREAIACGYRVISLGSNNGGDAATCGEELLEFAWQTLTESSADTTKQPVCILSGGEPTVDLKSAGGKPGKGGRNQELVLAAICRARSDERGLNQMAILSAGTDGEDGPTDAAGAIADSQLMSTIQNSAFDPAGYLRRHDAWHFFSEIEGLLKTGPTHTNVMDLRVVVIQPE